MFALQFSEYGDPGVLIIADAEEPHAGPGEIRIAVRATGLTPADDYVRSGRFRGFIDVPLPHIPGMDAAGVVDELGEGVTGVALGDAVFGLVDTKKVGGAAAEYAVLQAWAAKPDAFSWEQAGGAAANIETATRTLNELGVVEGTTLLIEGAAGGVGTITTQLAVARGATVIGTASVGNHELLASLGALPTTYGKGLAERVAALAPGGVVSVADLTAAEYGVRMSNLAPGSTAIPGHEGLAIAAALADEGLFTVPVHAVFALKDAARAHELSASRRARGKIVLTVP